MKVLYNILVNNLFWKIDCMGNSELRSSGGTKNVKDL
jgi:hypothetical protein